jgi:1-acyl-sn-glycerol-3-phosphate acyltransferase
VIGNDHLRRAPGKTRMQAMWWDLAERTAELIVRALWVLRVDGAERVPRTGPVIFISNHQSYLDPVVNGVATRDRQVGFLAKVELFGFSPFGRLIQSFGAIPLKERSDMAAMRAAIGELQTGRCIVVYPEGGRSDDGEVGVFHRGVALIVRRTKVPVVPMAVEGPYRVWPSSRRLPRPMGRLSVIVGEPISAETLLADEDDGVDRMRQSVLALQAKLRAREAKRG